MAQVLMHIFNGVGWEEIYPLPARHEHPWSDITGKPTTLSGYGITDAYNKSTINNMLNEKAPEQHGHAISEIIGLKSALDGKQPSGNYLTMVAAQNLFASISDLNSKANAVHDHDISEITSFGQPFIIDNAGTVNINTERLFNMEDVEFARKPEVWGKDELQFQINGTTLTIVVN